jgi:transcriptional regulator with XRE-family HTH domain
MLTPALVKAARYLAGLSTYDLSMLAGVGEITVKRFESGVSMSPSTLERLGEGLAKAGVAVIPNGADGQGPGVRLTKPLAEGD